MRLATFLLFVLAGCVNTAFAAQFKPNITYGSTTDTALLLNASIPDGPGLHPVVIVVHGGGWGAGDRWLKDMPAVRDALTTGSFTWFSIEYRLAPQHTWPACFEDVQTAIRWVKRHAKEYKGDPKRIALLGYSAGGHLVTLAAATAQPDTAVQAVVGYAPPTDLELDLPQRHGLSPSLQHLLNAPQAVTPQSRAQLHAMSPINLIHPGMPPFLVLHGDKDKSVMHQDCLNLIAKLKSCNVTAELYVIPGAGHRISDWKKIDPRYPYKMIDWLHATLGGAR